MEVKAIQKQMKELVTRLEAVEETCRQLRKENADIKRENKFLQREATDLQISLELKMESIEDDIKRMNQDIDEIEESTKLRMDTMDDVITKLGHSTKQLTMQSHRLTPLEKRRQERIESEVNVSLDTDSLVLNTGRWMTFTKVKRVNVNGGVWDGSTLKVHCKTPGRYLVNVVLHQINDGKIWVNAKSDKEVNAFMGETSCHDDIVSPTFVFDLSGQQNMWLEVKRCTGGATLRSCVLYCRLL